MVEATITGVDRGRILSDENYHLEAQTTASAADPTPTLERVETPVYNLVIDHPEGTILWDTGSHPDAGDGHWPEELYDEFEHVDAHEHRLADDLDDAGYELADIDYVVQSHLHVDHAGGLEQFAGTDVPVFVHEAELKAAHYNAALEDGRNGYVRADFDHDLEWRVVHRDRAQCFEDVEFLQLGGHTPGLLGMRIDLDGYGTVIFTSDVVEVAENYEAERPPGPALLGNREDWFESVRFLKDLERRHDAEVVFGHDPAQLDRILDGWP